MNERELSHASDIRAQEVMSLLESFWGKGNEIIAYSDPLITFETALKELRTALEIGGDRGKALVLQRLTGKPISIGIRYQQHLIAHSALLLQPWEDVETVGSIIDDQYRHRGLMTQINQKKRELLKSFAILGFQLTSYVILGSKSVDYGFHIFDFPKIDLRSWYCNLGPYVYSRPINPSRKESKRLTDYSLKTRDFYISSSAQVIGIKQNEPPIISADIEDVLPPMLSSLLSKYPVNRRRFYNPSPSRINTRHSSPARIDIYTLYAALHDPQSFYQEIATCTLQNRSIILRVPLLPGSAQVLEQVSQLSDNTFQNIALIPSGLSVYEGYWTACFSTIKVDRIPHFMYTLQAIYRDYHDSLRDLSEVSLRYLETRCG